MNTMSLYESGDSSGEVSLSGLCQLRFRSKVLKETHLDDLAYLIVRGRLARELWRRR